MSLLSKRQTYKNIQRAHKTGWKKGMCLNFVHTMWTIPSDGTQTAWLEAQKNERVTLTAKSKCYLMPFFFGTTAHNPDGHVVLLARKKRFGKQRVRMCWTTDYAGDGTITKQRLDDVQRWCGGAELGYSTTLDSRKLPN